MLDHQLKGRDEDGGQLAFLARHGLVTHLATLMTPEDTAGSERFARQAAEVAENVIALSGGRFALCLRGATEGAEISDVPHRLTEVRRGVVATRRIVEAREAAARGDTDLTEAATGSPVDRLLASVAQSAEEAEARATLPGAPHASPISDPHGPLFQLLDRMSERMDRLEQDSVKTPVALSTAPDGTGPDLERMAQRMADMERRMIANADAREDRLTETARAMQAALQEVAGRLVTLEGPDCAQGDIGSPDAPIVPRGPGLAPGASIPSESVMDRLEQLEASVGAAMTQLSSTLATGVATTADALRDGLVRLDTSLAEVAAETRETSATQVEHHSASARDQHHRLDILTQKVEEIGLALDTHLDRDVADRDIQKRSTRNFWLANEDALARLDQSLERLEDLSNQRNGVRRN